MKLAGLAPLTFIGLVTLIGIAVAISGCATMTTGTKQSIAINSQPDGAECTLKREGQTIGKVTTPGSVTITRSTQAIGVACTKDGYEEARAVLNSLVESRTHLNAIAGGVIGMMVDQASGASNRYEASAMLELTPLSPADQAAAAQAATQVATRPKKQSSPSAGAAAPQPVVPLGPPADPAAGLWDCKLGNNANEPRYTLTFSVAEDKKITVLNYNSALANLINANPLTFTATNPRGDRLTTFTWNADNSMSVTGPRSSDPEKTFRNVGNCAKK